LRPARGCSFEASGNEALPRKDDASCAEEGSKGCGANVVVGAESIERVSPDGDDCFEDFLPVKASQMDMAEIVHLQENDCRGTRLESAQMGDTRRLVSRNGLHDDELREGYRLFAAKTSVDSGALNWRRLWEKVMLHSEEKHDPLTIHTIA